MTGGPRTFTLHEHQRQALILALALLALERPGWDAFCRRIAWALGDDRQPLLYEGFQRTNAPARRA